MEFLFSEAALLSHLPKQHHKKLYDNESVTGYRLRRNHHLLARLMDAHILLSTDGTPTEALKCLSALNNAAKEQGLFHSFNWAGACTCFLSHLTEDHCELYNERLLDPLIEVMRKSTSPEAVERNLAFLMLAHPTSPDPFRAVEMIKDELKTQYAWKKGRRAVNNLGRTLLKTMLILDLQGATAEAQWARDTVQKKFRQVWANHDLIIASLSKDPKLKNSLKRSRAGSTKYDDGRSVAGDLLLGR